MVKEFSGAVKAYSEAHKVISKYKLWKYLLFPGIVAIVYSVLYILLANYLAGKMLSEADSYPSWLSWMKDFTIWFVRVVFWGGAIIFYVVTIKSVIQVFSSPVLSKLSEVVEMKLTNKPSPKLTIKDYIDDILRALGLSIRNLSLEIIYCFFLGFVPIVGVVIAFFISSYYYGFGYMDYTLERKRMTIRQSIKFTNKHRGTATGIGVVAQLGLFVPVIGWMIMPCYATVAATLQVIKITDADTGKKVEPFAEG